MPLRVNTQVPHGNACDTCIRQEAGLETVEFAADPHGGPEALWFCLRLEQTDPTPGQKGKAKLVLKHFDNLLGASQPENYRPVARRENQDWERLPPGTPEQLPDGRTWISWLIDQPERFVDLAFCYPYGQAELDVLLEEADGYWQTDTIGVSQASRPIVRLSNRPGEEGRDAPGLYAIARQHSGETPGSWVLDGFLRAMAAMEEQAPLVWAVPFSNVDGVEQGDYGKDNFPYDLNRAWGSPPMRHETLVIQRDLRRWKARCRPVLAFDFHAPGGGEGAGAYLYLPHPEQLPDYHQQAQQWAEALASALGPEYASENFARFVSYRSRWETPTFTRFTCETLEVCGITMETPYAVASDTLLTRERYQDLGARIAEAVCAKLGD